MRVLDVNGMRRVRTLRCGGKGITGVSKKNGKNGKSAQGDSSIENNVARCLEFSSDGRWVLAAALDGSVRVWDVPASRLLQTMVFSTSSPVTGMSLSPQMDMLATTHAGRRGVYLWANSTMYAPQGGAGTKSTKSTLGVGKNVSSDSEDSDSDDDSSEVRTFVTLPTLHADGDDAEDIVLGSDKKAGELVKETEGLSAQQSEDVLKLAPMAQTAAAKAPAPVPAAPGLATMALLPRSQWLGLLHLDSIRYVFLHSSRSASLITTPDGRAAVLLDCVPVTMLLVVQSESHTTTVPCPIPDTHHDRLTNSAFTTRERNKPIAPPTKPDAAPFFLPTTKGLAGDAVFDLDAGDDDDDDDKEDGEKEKASRILTNKGVHGGDVESTLLRLIRLGAAQLAEAEEQQLADAKKGIRPGDTTTKKKAAQKKGIQKRLYGAFETSHAIDSATDFYKQVTTHLRGKGPSGLDAEIRAIGPWDAATMTDDEAVELEDTLDFFAREIPSGRNFELLNALLAHFLRVHGSAIRERESLRMRAETVRAAARRQWQNVDVLLQEVRCALGFFGGQHGQ